MNVEEGGVAHSADLPRAQAGANSQRLLAAVLADYTFESAGYVSSSAIVRILAEFDITPAGTRKAISRLAERGILERHRDGRQTLYRVSDANLAVRMERLQRYLNFGEQREDWDGLWTVVVFSVAEDQRATRALLRAALSKRGFAPMADAVWVRAGDSTESLGDLAGSEGARVAVMSSRFLPGGGLDPTDAFDLASVRGMYEALIDQYQPIITRLREGSVDPREAFVVRARMMDAWRSVVILDPDLPRELLPPDWPRPIARRIFVELRDRLGPLALIRLRQLIEETDPSSAGDLGYHVIPPAPEE